jgi:large subunit ribosomal protein L1
MEQKQISEAIKKLKETSPKRNFKQTVDLIITLKDIDMKKTENQVNAYVNLPHSPGKEIKVCALVGPEMREEAKAADRAVLLDEFEKYKSDKKMTKKLASEFDFFVAQANLMVQVAQAFGRVFGPKGKMPNPKAGCVVPPKTNIKPLVDKLKKSVRVASKNTMMVQCLVGKEDMDEKSVIENIMAVYNQLLHTLPNERNNIKHVMLKLTMSKPVKIE